MANSMQIALLFWQAFEVAAEYSSFLYKHTTLRTGIQCWLLLKGTRFSWSPSVCVCTWMHTCTFLPFKFRVLFHSPIGICENDAAEKMKWLCVCSLRCTNLRVRLPLFVSVEIKEKQRRKNTCTHWRGNCFSLSLARFRSLEQASHWENIVVCVCVDGVMRTISSVCVCAISFETLDNFSCMQWLNRKIIWLFYFSFQIQAWFYSLPQFVFYSYPFKSVSLSTHYTAIQA